MTGNFELVNGETKLIVRGYSTGKNYNVSSLEEINIKQIAEEALGAERGVATSTGDLAALLAKWDGLIISEAKSLYTQLTKTEIQGGKSVVSQSGILAEINSSNALINPYSFAHPIEDIVLTQEALFIRVHNSWNANRRWLISIEEFRTFSSQDDMIKKLALPIMTNYMFIVENQLITKP